MNTFLVPIDFSRTSFCQLRTVRSLCGEDSRIDLVHVLDSGDAPSPESRSQMNNHLRHLDGLLKGQNVKTCGRFLDGAYIADVLEKEAERLDATAIVIGSHGHGALYETLFGSISRRLIATSQHPLIVVPAKIPRTSTIVPCVCVAVDFGPKSQDLVAIAAHMAADCGAELKLLHVVDRALLGVSASCPEPDPELEDYVLAGARSRLQDHVKVLDRSASSLPVETEVRTGAVPEMLIDAAKSAEGILVLGSHGHGRAYNLLLGSIAQEVVRKASTPVVVVPFQEKTPEKREDIINTSEAS